MATRSTDGPTGSRPAEAGPPLLVIRGGASPQEVAALVAVLQVVRAAAGPAHEERDRPVGSAWSGPRHRLRGPRTPPAAGPGGWRASALPQ